MQLFVGNSTKTSTHKIIMIGILMRDLKSFMTSSIRLLLFIVIFKKVTLAHKIDDMMYKWTFMLGITI